MGSEMCIRDREKDTLSIDEAEVLEKMVVRSLYGNINANRNSA